MITSPKRNWRLGNWPGLAICGWAKHMHGCERLCTATRGAIPKNSTVVKSIGATGAQSALAREKSNKKRKGFQEVEKLYAAVEVEDFLEGHA